MSPRAAGAAAVRAAKEAKERRLCLGSHLSVAGGPWKAVEEAIALRLRSLQIFSKNASRWTQRPIAEEEAERFRERRAEWGDGPVFSHASYLINLAAEGELADKSREALVDELERAAALGLDGVIQHPGAHVGAGVEAGIERIARAARSALDRAPRGPRLLLENTAGAGSTLGRSFEELGALLAMIDRPERTGVCLDTCHLFAAGYELRTAEGFEATMAALEREVGADRVLCWHLNDSRGDLGSHLDRHEHIGTGKLGRAAFRLLLADARFFGVPKILETPKEGDADRANLALLRRLGT
jgi:deoxyribonuclease-4